MECTCLIGQYNDGENHPSVSSTTYPKARKEHTCCECKETIKPGEVYERHNGCWDGAWRTYLTCMPCQRIRKAYCCSWVYGELHDDIWGALGVDYITGELNPIF